MLASIGIVRGVAVDSSGDHKVARYLNSVEVGQPSGADGRLRPWISAHD